ncbi:MAG: hypothetical protein AB9869_24290 [Verrucomicrobiia bacterium]
MRLELLKRLLAVPSPSRQEQHMVALVLEHVRQRGPKRCGRAWGDRWNNVYIRKGSTEPVPLVCAHLDTVYNWTQVEVVEQDGLLVGFGPDGNRSGIGADDRCGVLICLELLERFDNIAVALFAQEEIGYIGAQNADADFFGSVGSIVEFDAPAMGLVSYSAGGQRLFENNGEFIQTAMPVLRRFGFIRFQHHPFTDLTGLRTRFPISCLNVSCGYYDWHSDHESVKIGDVEHSLEMATELVAALGNHRYGYAINLSDTAAPPVEVTEFRLPERTEPRRMSLCTRR